jgi:hypothetical protein
MKPLGEGNSLIKTKFFDGRLLSPHLVKEAGVLPNPLIDPVSRAKYRLNIKNLRSVDLQKRRIQNSPLYCYRPRKHFCKPHRKKAT